MRQGIGTKSDKSPYCSTSFNIIPDSEIEATFFSDTFEKRVEILVIIFTRFHPLISMKSDHKKIHEKSSTYSTGDKATFFDGEILGVGGPKILASETGTIGANGQAELLEAGWALQALQGTNSLGKSSIVSSWRHKFL